MEHQLPIIVFDVAEPDAVFHALRGDRIGTLVSSEPEGETPPPLRRRGNPECRPHEILLTADEKKDSAMCHFAVISTESDGRPTEPDRDAAVDYYAHHAARNNWDHQLLQNPGCSRSRCGQQRRFGRAKGNPVFGPGADPQSMGKRPSSDPPLTDNAARIRAAPAPQDRRRARRRPERPPPLPHDLRSRKRTGRFRSTTSSGTQKSCRSSLMATSPPSTRRARRKRLSSLKAEAASNSPVGQSGEAEFLGDPISPISGGRVPRHVAIIMDGTGRWATQRGLPRVAGHRAGTVNIPRSSSASRTMA